MTIFTRYRFAVPLWRLFKIIPVGKSWYDHRTLGQRAIDHYFINWLMPIKGNLKRMLWILNKAIHEKRSYVEFTLHSSELMPGGSPTFPNKKDVEQLYRDLEIIFRVARKNFVGSTLYEFYNKVLKDHILNAKNC